MNVKQKLYLCTFWGHCWPSSPILHIFQMLKINVAR